VSREALEEGDARLEDSNAELQNHCARRSDVGVERRACREAAAAARRGGLGIGVREAPTSCQESG
jgi:hypothetical protein